MAGIRGIETMRCAIAFMGLAACSATAASALELKSAAFSAAGSIPARYTCDAGNVSPPLSWSGVPEGTRTYVLIVEDPDAPSGHFVHWLLYGLPSSTTVLQEDRAREGEIDGARQGINDFQRVGYGGPCPPPGKTHRYVFTLYALDAPMKLDAGIDSHKLRKAMRGHVLGQAELTGKYQRSSS